MPNQMVHSAFCLCERTKESNFGTLANLRQGRNASSRMPEYVCFFFKKKKYTQQSGPDANQQTRQFRGLEIPGVSRWRHILHGRLAFHANEAALLLCVCLVSVEPCVPAES